MIATYKNKDGLYDSACIEIVGHKDDMPLSKDGDSVVLDLSNVAAGTYTLKAGEQEVKFEVVPAVTPETEG